MLQKKVMASTILQFRDTTYGAYKNHYIIVHVRAYPAAQVTVVPVAAA